MTFDEWMSATHPDHYISYDEYLDDGGQVNIGGLWYSHSYAWRMVDPIAYKLGFNDWIDNLRFEFEHGLLD